MKKLATIAVLLILWGTAACAATATVQLNAPSNVGDVAEVGITLDYADSAPAVLIIYLAFDNMRLEPVQDYYETIPVDSHGDLVRDSDGNVQVVLSAAQSAPEVAAARKAVDVAYYERLDDNVARGGIGIAVAGLNTDPLPKGTVLTVAFRVLSGNSSNDVVAVYGVDSARPIIIDGHVVSSSASASSGDSVSLTVADGSVALGCVRPAAPSGVTASQNKNDRVDIAWNGAVGFEYRVFRSAGLDPLSAQALGSSWTTGTVFADVTAAAPRVVTSPDCFTQGVYEAVAYHYWVRSRDLLSGCESNASSPAVQGWRVTVEVAVPDTVGQTQSAASSILAGVGLTPGTVTQQFSDTIPLGQVIIQCPAAGTQALTGSTVALIVSKGPAILVPNVVGKDEIIARSMISGAGLKIGDVTRAYSPTVLSGIVIDQSPITNSQVVSGAEVDITVSKGPESQSEGEGEPPTPAGIGQALYDGFSAADTNHDGVLSPAEAQTALPSLTQAMYSALDADGNGNLSKTEIEDYLGIGPSYGCSGCNKASFMPGAVKDLLGNLFLAGLSFSVLIFISCRQ